MDLNESELPPEDVISKLDDASVLRSYCEFSAIHRATIATVLVASLNGDVTKRRAIGLELLGVYAAALEDVALWFFVLREWKPGENHLFDLIDKIAVVEGEGSKYRSTAALAEISEWTANDLRRELNLPNNELLLQNGWSAADLPRVEQFLNEWLSQLMDVFRERTDHEGTLVNSYNKAKHGVLAIPTTEHSHIGISLMVPSRRGQRDPVSRKKKINTGWIACDDEALQVLANNTILVTRPLWGILNLLYAYHFDHDWIIPTWPVTDIDER